MNLRKNQKRIYPNFRCFWNRKMDPFGAHSHHSLPTMTRAAGFIALFTVVDLGTIAHAGELVSSMGQRVLLAKGGSDDTLNPFDDADQEQGAQQPSGQEKDLSGGILNSDHFDKQTSPITDPSNFEGSLDQIEDGPDGQTPLKKNSSKHEFGEKDIEKALSDKQKTKKNKKNMATPIIKDDIQEKRAESQKKALDHEQSLKIRQEKEKSLLATSSSVDNGLPISSSDTPIIPVGQKNSDGESIAMQHEGIGDSSSNNKTPLNQRYRHSSDAVAAVPGYHPSQNQGQDQTPEQVAQDPPKPSGQKTRNQSGFNEEDFDSVKHVSAGQDAYLLPQGPSPYEPTLYTEHQAVSILKGSSNVSSRQGKNQRFLNTSGEVNDDGASPFESREGGGDSYQLDSGLFGDPFVTGVVGPGNSPEEFEGQAFHEGLDPEGVMTSEKTGIKTSSGGALAQHPETLPGGPITFLQQEGKTAENGSAAKTKNKPKADKVSPKGPSSDTTTAMVPSSGHDDGLARPHWKNSATQGTLRNIRLLETPEASEFQVNQQRNASVDVSGGGQELNRAIHPVMEHSPKKTETPSETTHQTKGLHAKMIAETRLTNNNNLIKKESMVKGITEEKPKFSLSLAIRQQHLSLSQVGMNYEVTRDFLLKNAVAKGSLQYGVIGYPLKDLGIKSPSPELVSRSSQNYFSNIRSLGGVGWSMVLAGLGLLVMGGSMAIQRFRRFSKQR